MDSRKKQTDDRRVNVGISIPSSELDVMREAARVDANGPAVLAMARLGIECWKRDGGQENGKGELHECVA